MSPGPGAGAARAVLFDMGGVLLDMGNAAGMPTGRADWRGREVLAHALEKSGGRVALEDLEEILFAPWRAEHARRYETGHEARWEPHLARLRRATGARARNLTLLAAWFRPYAEQLAPLPGAREVLGELGAAGVRLALVSNVPLPGRLYERVLRRHGLLAPFAARLFSYDAGSRKPSPAMLRQALDALEVSPGDAVMVGDRRRTDVAAGRAAGVRTVWLRGGDHEGPRPDVEIDALHELPAALGTGSAQLGGPS
jgi:HAD superfamily hydrolase (TIGR01662 family)